MEAVDGLLELADAGVCGQLNVMVAVDCRVYLQIVCQFTYPESGSDLSEFEKEEIISGCVPAIVCGSQYESYGCIQTYRNLTVSLPFLTTCSQGCLSSTWFTTVELTSATCKRDALMLEECVSRVSKRVSTVTIQDLKPCIRDLVECVLLDQHCA